ncbi:MAG: hypothetical protein A3J74_06420 [Elusimicrobia bacterium RIFCSPHIGHO2_02_FULL_57_9]|nr:MAG: hypothetical protein A3J74_06420 [Elusimicrobia bacterium RIFCSPHIGHO2_02_FULL_57_9]
MPQPPYLSVVLPIYNEQERLSGALQEVVGYLLDFPESWEIVIVDDGSRDKSGELVGQWMQREPNIKFLRLARNQGKGAAVKAGMLHATGRYRLFRDADSSTQMRELPAFLRLLENGAHVVIGSRRVKGAGIIRHQALLRESLGKGFVLLCRFLLVWEVRDFTCGFKCFSAQAAQDIFSRQTINRWAFDAEILFLANKLGYPIAQVPVIWKDEPGSKVRVFWAVLRSLRELGQVVFNNLTGAYNIASR